MKLEMNPPYQTLFSGKRMKIAFINVLYYGTMFVKRIKSEEDKMVIDFHSHILPAIDDGSKDLNTSVNMVRQCEEQGVECIMATPHFYAVHDKMERFLKRRDRAYEKLMEELSDGAPEIYLGGEVAFFRGISRAEHLEELTMGNSDLILLEMPFAPWSSSDIAEVERLVNHSGFRYILAHLERYLAISENKREIERLLELPVVVQVNAGSLLEWKTRGRTLRLLKKSESCVLGSDCHGIHHRTPNLEEGRKMVEKKLGKDFLNRIDSDGERLIESIRRG